MGTDPDAIWKPGYHGPAPVASRPDRAVATPWATGDTSGDPGRRGHDAHRSPGRRRRVLVAGVAVLLVAGVLVVGERLTRSPSDDLERSVDSGSAEVDTTVPDVAPTTDAEPPGEQEAATDAARAPTAAPVEAERSAVFTGAAHRRLPSTSTLLWSTTLPATEDTWAELVGRDTVLVAGTPPPSEEVAAAAMLTAFDAVSGARRWETPLDRPAGDTRLLGAVDDVIVLEQLGVVSSVIVGLNRATGAEEWRSGEEANAGHVALAGTNLIARLPASPDVPTRLISSSSGIQTTAVDGTIVATDGAGRWYADHDGVITEIDLGVSPDGAFVGEAERTILGTVAPGAPWAVVGGRLVTTDTDGALVRIGSAEAGGDPSGAPLSFTASVGTIIATSPTSVAVTGPGLVAGAAIGDSAGVTWQREFGVITKSFPVGGGTVLQLTMRGGAAQQLIDGVTGETIVDVTMRQGSIDALIVGHDGIVTLRASTIGTRLVGVGLDGEDRWSLPGAVPVVLGDRVMARAEVRPAADAGGSSFARPLEVELAVYGDAS